MGERGHFSKLHLEESKATPPLSLHFAAPRNARGRSCAGGIVWVVARNGHRFPGELMDELARRGIGLPLTASQVWMTDKPRRDAPGEGGRTLR